MKQIRMRGMVVHGDGYGTRIRFPTANITRRGWSRLIHKPRLGIWAGWVMFQGKGYRAGIVIGPIDKSGLPKLEAHLLDFTGNLYGQTLIFVLSQYVRPFKRYKSERELIQAIQKDITIIRKANI